MTYIKIEVENMFDFSGLSHYILHNCKASQENIEAIATNCALYCDEIEIEITHVLKYLCQKSFV